MVFGTFGNQKVKTPNNLTGLCIGVWWVMYLFFSVLLENWGLCFTFELVNCVVVYKLSFLFRWIYLLFLSWFINLDRKYKFECSLIFLKKVLFGLAFFFFLVYYEIYLSKGHGLVLAILALFNRKRVGT